MVGAIGATITAAGGSGGRTLGTWKGSLNGKKIRQKKRFMRKYLEMGRVKRKIIFL
jgi:hypothetical protein